MDHSFSSSIFPSSALPLSTDTAIPLLSPSTAVLLCVGSLLLLAAPRLQATAAYHPFVSFTVYNSSNCTGPLFTVDRNWQWCTALNDSQATVYNSSYLLATAHQNRTGPNCATNPAPGVVSAIVSGYQCMYCGSAGAALNVSGYATAGCATIPSDQRVRIFSYFFNDALTSPNACHAAILFGDSSNCRDVNVGITMQLTQQDTSNSAISSMGRRSTTLLWSLVSLMSTFFCTAIWAL